MAENDLLSRLRKLDAYPKTLDEFRVRTLQGGLSTIVAVFVAMWLIHSELQYSYSVYTTDTLYVNSSHGAAISVAFDIEFPRVSCDLITVAATDQAGQPMADFSSQHVRKLKMGKDGRRRSFHSKQPVGLTATSEDHISHADEAECGDCYGAQNDETPCCNTCDDVRRAYRNKGWTFRPATVSQCRSESSLTKFSSTDDGCAVAGDLVLPAVSGNFHFAPGRHISEARHLATADLVAMTFQQFNVTHTIKRLEFSQHELLQADGADDDDDDDDGGKSRRTKKKLTRKQQRLLNKRRRIAKKRAASSQLAGVTRTINDGYGMHQYYLKVVPSHYTNIYGESTAAAKYSVTEHLRHIAPGSGRGLPGVFFFYEISPVCAKVQEHRDGLLSFFVGIAAIVGGVYVTFGIIDKSLAYAREKVFVKPRSTVLD